MNLNVGKLLEIIVFHHWMIHLQKITPMNSMHFRHIITQVRYFDSHLVIHWIWNSHGPMLNDFVKVTMVWLILYIGQYLSFLSDWNSLHKPNNCLTFFKLTKIHLKKRFVSIKDHESQLQEMFDRDTFMAEKNWGEILPLYEGSLIRTRVLQK